MPVIKGPFTIMAGQELPKEIKKGLKKCGIRLSFKATKFSYSNKELDDWFREKREDEIYKLDRAKGEMVKEK